MERKYITKGDLNKLIKENGLVPYSGGAESADQYADNETMTKMMFSEVDHVEWESRKVPDNGHMYYIGKVNVDWGVKLHFTSNGYSTEPFIRSVTGTLRAYEYNENGRGQKNQDFPFSSKGYRFEVDWEYLNRDGVTSINSVEINMDTKTINFNHFNLDPNRDVNHGWN